MKRLGLFMLCSVFQLVSFSYGQIIPMRDTLSCGSPVTLAASATPRPSTASYLVSQIAYSPESFTAGTLVTGLQDDGYSSNLPIGFAFCFFGTAYTEFYISANGWISFTQANQFQQLNTSPSSFPSTNNNVPRNVVAMWDDWSPSLGGTVSYFTSGTAPSRKLVVNWNDVPHYACGTDAYRGQIILYEGSNVIEFHTGKKPSCVTPQSGPATQGIHNAAGTTAFVVPGRNAAVFALNNDAWQFSPNGPDEIPSIKWFNGNDQIGSGNSIVVSPAADTEYIAELTYACSPGVFRDTVLVRADTTSIDATATDALCFGSATGSVSVTVSGASSPYTYSWNTTPPSNAQSVNALPAGSYSVTVSNTSCFFSDLAVVSQPSELIIDTVTDPSSCGDSTGVAILTVSGGVGSYTYTWSNGANTSTIADVPAGTYSFTVTDGNGCTETGVVTVGSYSSVTASFSPSVSQGKAPLSVTFSNTSSGAETYSWDFGNGQTSTSSADPSATYQNAGTYIVTLLATYNNICTDSYQATIVVTRDSVIIPEKFFVPNIVSLSSENPENRKFQLGGDFEDLRMIIFDRWGRTAFEANSPDAEWIPPADAHTGTYYYIITYKIRGSNSDVVKGFFSLTR